MIKTLLFFAFPALLFGIVVLAIWMTVREKRQFDRTATSVNSGPITPRVPGAWFLVSENGEHGPFGHDQLQKFRNKELISEESLLKEAASGELIQAATIPGLFSPMPPLPNLEPLPVAFEIFSGHRDPVRLGKGHIAIREGVLILHGRKRRAFAWRKEDEAIPFDRISDVVVDGRVVRFTEEGTKRQLPRLIQLKSVEAVAQLVALLPKRQSVAGAQLKADNEEFTRFMAGGKPAVTVAIILINFAIYIWMGGRSNTWAQFNPGMLTELGGNLGPYTTNGEWWRLLSAVFLHSGLMHVLMNMLALWEAGRVTERLFGHARYLGVYLATGLLASVASINWQQEVVSIGASGAVFGIYGVLMAALVLDKQLLPVSVTKRLRNGAIIFVGYALLASLGQKGIDHAAHVGGLFAGILFGAALVLPRLRMGLVLALTAGLSVAGVLGAISANDPFADEPEFRRFMAQFGQEENRLNAIARDIMPQADRIGTVNLARRIDAELIPGWKAMSDKFGSMTRLLPLTRELRDPLYQHVRLKHEALVMLRDAFRSEDDALARHAGEQLQEANRHADIVKQILATRLAQNSQKSQKSKTQQTPVAAPPVPPLPSVADTAIAKFIKAGDRVQASREVFRQATDTYGKGADIIAEQLLAGHLDDALANLPKLHPGGQNYVYFRAIKDGENFTDHQKLDFARKSAEAVRGKQMPANIASDALVRAALGVLRYGSHEEAMALMKEALDVARQGRNEEQGAALRALPDVLDAETWVDPRPLMAIVEEAARVQGNPFHQAFAMASVSHLWHRLGHTEKAWAWWREGLQIVKTIPEKSRSTTAESRFARIAAEFGERALASEMIAARRGSFVDVLAKDVIVTAAKRGEFAQVMADFSAMKPGCGSSISSGGFGARDAVEVLAKRGEFAVARQLLAQMPSCAPRFVAESWILLGVEEHARGEHKAASESLRKGVESIRSVTNRTWDKFELQVMVKAAELAALLENKGEAATLLSDVVSRAEQISPHRVDEKVTVLTKAGQAAIKTGQPAKAAEYFTRAYQLSVHFPKDIPFPEMSKARALATTAQGLAEK